MRRRLANVEKQKGDIVDDMIVEAENSFSDAVMNEPIPEKFKMPSLTPYDGTTDPADHIEAFSSWMRLHGIHEYIMCRAFPTTLMGSA